MKLNPIFSDHMVFAANKPIRIYGEGAGEGRITFAGQTQKIQNDGGRWMVEIPSMEEGGPYTLEAELKGEKTAFTDIFIGKVYLFAGQSNMQFKMKESSAPKGLYESIPALRLFMAERIEKTDHHTPKDGWVQAEEGMVSERKQVQSVVCRDICETNDIHPPTKHLLAERIASVLMNL